MPRYYTLKFYIDNYDKNLNQRKITKDLVDKICELLGCDYDRLGWILWEPDYPSRQSGRMYKKKNSEMFFKQKIESIVYPIKHPEEGPSSPCLIYETDEKGLQIAPSFEISISYAQNPEKFSTRIEITVPKILLKHKKININIYQELLKLINKNNFHVHYSLLHCHTKRLDSYTIHGMSHGFFYTIEEWLIIDKALNHVFDWKNKLLDVFCFNTIIKESIPNNVLSKLEKIIGKKNIFIDDEYITFIYPVCKLRYLFDKYIPSIKKIRIRKLLKDNNLLPKKTD